MISLTRKNCDSFGSLKLLNSRLKDAFTSIKEEFEEHLQAINENTNELKNQESYLCEIDTRLEKLEEKTNETHLMMSQILNKINRNIELSRDDQRVFLFLYTTERFVSLQDVADKSFLSLELAEEALMSLANKGIHIERELLNGTVFFQLKKEFKLKQAKENIVKIDAEITRQFQHTLLNQFFNEV